MSLIGHNGGPSVEGGTSWRTHCWRAARDSLLPTLPIEVVRMRVRRAAELGLDYRTYAGVRATTGRDIVAFLFSSNALRMIAPSGEPDPGRVARVSSLRGAGRLVAVHRPLCADHARDMLAARGVVVDACAEAPTLLSGWRETRDTILGLVAEIRRPADQVLLIGDTTLERGWAEAGRLAGYLPSDRYFGTSAQSV